MSCLLKGFGITARVAAMPKSAGAGQIRKFAETEIAPSDHLFKK
jgi:hypothetical protein